MTDPGPSNSPTSAHHFEVTDEQLSAELKKWTGTTPALQPVGELLDRHWEAAFSYARLCTDGPHHAGMLTTAAFTRLFGESLRQSGPTAAWRPQVLVTVRRIAAEWVADHRQEMLHPDLRWASGDGDRGAARMLPVPERRLLSRAFQRLPQAARTLLWHIEVESEPYAIPAGLLGLDEEGADIELGAPAGGCARSASRSTANSPRTTSACATSGCWTSPSGAAARRSTRISPCTSASASTAGTPPTS